MAAIGGCPLLSARTSLACLAPSRWYDGRPFNCRVFRDLSLSHRAHTYMEGPHRGSGQSSQFTSRPSSTPSPCCLSSFTLCTSVPVCVYDLSALAAFTPLSLRVQARPDYARAKSMSSLARERERSSTSSMTRRACPRCPCVAPQTHPLYPTQQPGRCFV